MPSTILRDPKPAVGKIKNLFTSTPPRPEGLPGYEPTITEEEQMNQTPLSERILLALSRMKQAETSPHEGVDMSEYFRTEGEVCYACLGGWGLMGRLSLNATWMLDRNTFDIAAFRDISFWSLGCYQTSLDRARNGNVYEAFVMMGFGPTEGKKYNRQVADYHDDPSAFYQDMHQLADHLQQDGY